MGGAEFEGWMGRCGLSYRTASMALGVHKRTVIRYAKGHSLVPRAVQLACKAVEEGLHGVLKDSEHAQAQGNGRDRDRHEVGREGRVLQGRRGRSGGGTSRRRVQEGRGG